MEIWPVRLTNYMGIKIGNVYVIVDCGGGTVVRICEYFVTLKYGITTTMYQQDLISYEVTSTTPLRVKECTVGTGDLCGSIFINRRFEDLVICRIGQE